MIVGTEWLIEAADCDPEKLRDETALRAIFERVVAGLDLRVLDSLWHSFPGAGGVTGLAALTESHLACHTYPEHRTATFNLYCCRTRPEWDWTSELKSALGAQAVFVSKIERGSNSRSHLKSEIEELKTKTAGGDR
jgi:S-adenosylmethionine decarboxylase